MPSINKGSLSWQREKGKKQREKMQKMKEKQFVYGSILQCELCIVCSHILTPLTLVHCLHHLPL